ncbi:plasma membrane iron permease [Sodiomyces alkalinus F11]|uniref:Plasma membrane iron permease n=1 Tax=Sodiomyces alkalinus (strain CBS 110278 / VKM F-3762 / F11) TaxID=1314773 RepID=A0A3N2PU24_SODAK|nr:plasma membrane iron permease [Sodiomyces alkalinus F11]ROT37826.1 plasma membrane iron permease [Sodiomyces alkalinus F11]
MEGLFSLPIFFISFREALETGIIVSVLLAIIKRTLSPQDVDASLHATMVRQVWLGTAIGILTCVLLGAAIIGGVYGLAAEQVSGAEALWEAVFSLVASLVITVMGAVLLRVGKLQDKWRAKLARAIKSSGSDAGPGRSGSLVDRVKFLGEKYALFILPFITVMREGFEGILFIAGAGFGLSALSIIVSALAGFVVGGFVGYLIYRGSNVAPIHYFLVFSTCLLYLVAAGLFSRGIWHLEANEWNQIVGGDAAELGSGPGSYDIRKSVWHVNCCNPYLDGGGFWGIFNAVLGWQNSATVGSVVSYNLYWVAVAAGFVFMGFKEKRAGRRRSDAPASQRTRSVEAGDHEPLLAHPAR